MTPSVLLISGDYLPNIGGLAGHVHELACALQRSGHRVSVLTSVKSGDQDSSEIEVHRIPPKYSKARWIARPQIIVNTRAYVENLRQAGGADIIHWHTLDHFCHALARISHPAKIFTNHTSHFTAAIKRGRHRRLRKLIGHANAWITPSEQLRQETLELGLREDCVHFISNGVNAENFRPGSQSQAREQLGLDIDGRYILYAGRVGAVKGTDILLRTIQQLDKNLEPDVRFIIVGDHARPNLSEFERQIDNQSAELRAKGRLIFLGPKNRDDMILAYQAADLAILPSRNEATSLTALEAMSTGLPLIASAIGGLLQIVDHNEDGILVPCENVAQFSQAIIELLQDPLRRNDMGQKARAKILREWTWDAVATKTSKLYTELLSKRLN